MKISFHSTHKLARSEIRMRPDKPWHTSFTAYGEMDGYRIPVKGSAVWTLGDGDFTYIDVVISGIEYNPESE